MEFEGVFFNTSDFELQKHKIGEGSFGTVYTVRNAHDNQIYAAKIIHTDGNFNGDSQRLLMRESIILSRLHHPCIVSFKGVNFQSFTDPTKLEPSIITEFLSQGSLKAALDNERRSMSIPGWTPTAKYIVLLGITSAMRYLHARGIVHRDLKPENILLDAQNRVRVCDFGLSRCFPESFTKSMNLTMTGQIGTPLYMAPELLRCDDNYTAGVDVYAFSMLAYELVTGKAPFSELGNRITAFALGKKVTDGYRPKIPDFVPKKMRDMLEKCWSAEAKDRPSFDEIFTELSSDTAYFDEEVDEDEVRDYIESLEAAGATVKARDPTEETGYVHARNVALEEEVADLKKRVQSFTASNGEFILALHALHGHEQELNGKSAVDHLKMSSDRGNSYASFLLGQFYANGRHVERNFDTAIHYFEHSTVQGNTYGLNAIGFCYEKGLNVQRNYLKALEYYQKSSDLGNSDASNNLGNIYRDGLGVKRNYSKALEYYQKSSDLGNSDASNNLGNIYRDGLGVKQDYSKALEYYQKSSDLDNSTALNNLGYLYEKGLGVKQDCSKALEYYQKSSDLGNSSASNYLGWCYHNGLGVNRNYSKALEYYQKSSDLGNSTALINLGYLYENGLGVKCDYSKALEYYQKSSDLGNSNALINIGYLYENGLGVKQDYSKALEYYQKSSDLGNPKAPEFISNINKRKK